MPLNNKTEQLTASQLQQDPRWRRRSLASKSDALLPKHANTPVAPAPVAPVRRPTPGGPLPTAPRWRPTPAYDCLLGIDPGVHTGLCIRLTPHTLLLTSSFWRTRQLILDLFATYGTRLLVVIEDPNVHRSLYANKDGSTGEARTKIAQNIGANKREASLLIEFCLDNGIPVDPVAPLGKLDPKQFSLRYGITKGSQHARDAARLVLDR